jgi:protein arginine kinase
VQIRDLNELFIRTQPAHLQKLRGVELDTADRNIERARYLRKHLNKEDGRGEQN